MVSDVIQFESLMKEEICFASIDKAILTQLVDYCYTAMIGPFVMASWGVYVGWVGGLVVDILKTSPFTGYINSD